MCPRAAGTRSTVRFDSLCRTSICHTSLEAISSVPSSDSPNTGKNQKKANTPMIVGGSIGAIGLLVSVVVFLSCRLKAKRSAHAARRIVSPFPPSSPDINQISDTSARLMEGSVFEVTINGYGRGKSESSGSVATTGDARTPVQRQLRTAGRTFNRTRSPLEKRQRNNEQREFSGRVDRGDDERIWDLPAPVLADRRPRTRSNRIPNILRHLDSGIRTMQFSRQASAREQRVTEEDSRERRLVEANVELPPEYSFE
ncbi:hypothetical protein K435DRAFT_870465 [Dendrothele bispora CBS 962.96]|uniref:Uncharacterized protein n=1 Tax=Dendrothele bispora (strain CBS 962.96) TaxID=1314807 RepID=A0A4S8L781_DENBC|nr:hypothetical protein K435DRAFT_870465 [Dendrothele bispora CBS 962.96]